MAQTYNLGKVSVTPRGAFNASTAYEQLDVVTYSGSSYLVLQSVTGVTPPNATYYQLIASKGDTGSNGQSPTISVGTVTYSGDTATVENVGTNINAVFDFNFPENSIIVTLTYDEQLDEWESDTPVEDIYAEASKGNKVYSYNGSTYYELGWCDVDYASFTAVYADDGLGTSSYDITNDAVYYYERSVNQIIQDNIEPRYVSESNSHTLNTDYLTIYGDFNSGRAVIISVNKDNASYFSSRVIAVSQEGQYYYVYALEGVSVVCWRANSQASYPVRAS